MTTTPDFLTAKMPYGSLATAFIFQLFFVFQVNLLLNNSSDNVF
jgi:hypothetical protein